MKKLYKNKPFFFEMCEKNEIIEIFEICENSLFVEKTEHYYILGRQTKDAENSTYQNPCVKCQHLKNTQKSVVL